MNKWINNGLAFKTLSLSERFVINIRTQEKLTKENINIKKLIYYYFEGLLEHYFAPVDHCFGHQED